MNDYWNLMLQPLCGCMADQEKQKFITDELNCSEYKEILLDILSHEGMSIPTTSQDNNSKFETRFKESILPNHFYYKKNIVASKDNASTIWDYAIYDKKNNLCMLVNTHDDDDVKCVPNGVKYHIISEENFSNDFKEMIERIIPNYDEYVDNLFNTYRNMEFPYPSYSNRELIDSYKRLLKLNKLNLNNRDGDKLIHHFHHSIYHAHTYGKISPYDAWYDNKLLMKTIQNRILYRTSLNANKILQGFNVSKIAPKVSVFSAGRAKCIIQKYLSEYNEIFDPFSGFSGRMLATMSLGKQYIGQDISDIHISESLKMIEFLNKCHNHFQIINPILSCTDTVTSKGEYDSLFTCSPYGNKEIWKNDITSNNTCDEWIDVCLNNFKCKRYVFVVDETIRYSKYISDEIINSSHFGTNREYIIMINK